METMQSICNRRSIRKYTDQPVPKETMERIIQAGIQAPSAKNRQPWKFVVAVGDAKNSLLDEMEKGIQEQAKGQGILCNSGQYIAGAENTLRIMKQAPVAVIVLNPQGKSLREKLDAEDRVYEIADIQSIGAAMQNMALAAAEYGLGSLWICDIFFAYERLTQWLDTQGEMVAAMSFGYPEESPDARPRKPVADVIEWRGQI